MNSVRRAALRAASSAALVAPKAQTANLAGRFAASAPTKVIAVRVARLFNTCAIRPNEESQKSFEDVEAASASQDPGSLQTNEAAGQKPAEAEFMAEPNGVYGVFVWNVPYRSTEREMFDTFSRFGKVHSLNIGRDARGLSRGFAFVYYQSIEDARTSVSQADGAFWQGRRIGAKPKNPSDGTGSSPGSRSSNNSAGTRVKTSPTSSLYVGNIPYEATDSELNNLFSGLDNILDVRVAIDKATGWPRGFAHADFADVDSANKALERLSTVSIQGRLLRIDYSESKKPGTSFSAADNKPGPNDRTLD